MGPKGVQRVLSETGIVKAVLGERSGASKRLKKLAEESGAHLPVFAAPSQLKPFITSDLIEGPLQPIDYLDGTRMVRGYDASINHFHQQRNRPANLAPIVSTDKMSCPKISDNCPCAARTVRCIAPM